MSSPMTSITTSFTEGTRVTMRGDQYQPGTVVDTARIATHEVRAVRWDRGTVTIERVEDLSHVDD